MVKEKDEKPKVSKKDSKVVFTVVKRFKEINVKKGYDTFEIGDAYKANAERLELLQTKGFIEEVKTNDTSK